MKAMHCLNRSFIARLKVSTATYCITDQRGKGMSVGNFSREKCPGDIRGKIPRRCPDTNFSSVSNFNTIISLGVSTSTDVCLFTIKMHPKILCCLKILNILQNNGLLIHYRGAMRRTILFSSLRRGNGLVAYYLIDLTE